MKFVLIIFLMLACGIIAELFIKYARYNTSSDKFIVVSLSMLYSAIWLWCAINCEETDSIIYIYFAGVGQGVSWIISTFYIYIKYKNKALVSECLRKNKCRIITFDWIEEFSENEIQKLYKMSEYMAGRKGNNFLFIAKDKIQGVKLIFFIYKRGGWSCIQEACDKYCVYELKKSNKRKQVIMCRLSQ